MKSLTLFLLIVCAGVLVCGCQPDLVVSIIEVTGSSSVDSAGNAVVPIRVVVKNQGNAEAGIFKVSTEYTDVGNTLAVAFDVPGHPPVTWYQSTTVPLDGGSEREFTGNVIFNPALHNITVSLRAIADSCAGDENTPAYCRVDESDETNNKSADISISLP